MLKGKDMKKQYKKPAMQAYDIKMTQMLCGSLPEYPGPFNYVPNLHKTDELLKA